MWVVWVFWVVWGKPQYPQVTHYPQSPHSTSRAAHHTFEFSPFSFTWAVQGEVEEYVNVNMWIYLCISHFHIPNLSCECYQWSIVLGLSGNLIYKCGYTYLYYHWYYNIYNILYIILSIYISVYTTLRISISRTSSSKSLSLISIIIIHTDTIWLYVNVKLWNT